MENETRIIHINRPDQAQEEIKFAVDAVIGGGLVVFPTETVYGLGANSLLEEPVRKIFEVKGRPPSLPLTYHLPSATEVEPFVKNISDSGRKLMDKFFPGPITLVFEKSEIVPDIITGGSRKVGVRVPNHKATLEFLKQAKVPLVATSANISGKPASTKLEHIVKDLGGKVDIILDSGDSPLGIESTVIDVTSEPPRLIRTGYITQEEIAGVVGRLPLLSEDSIGMPKLPRYTPRAKIIVVVGDGSNVITELQNLAEEYKKHGKVVMVITEESLIFLEDSYPQEMVSLRVMGSRRNYHGIAQHLFRMLRNLEEEDVATILVEGVSREGLGTSIMDRLYRVANEIKML